MTRIWTAEDVRQTLLMRDEIAVVDLRSEAEFATGHPLFATPFAVDVLETDALARIPRLTTPICLYGLEEPAGEAAAARLRAVGYSHAGVLRGGLLGWESAGYEVFIDVNSPSKAFGELVEHRAHTPSLSAAEVRRLLDENADIAILDARRPDEFLTMCIPGGTSVPGAELVLRATTVAPSKTTTVVVNCAGRTRSIIGTQSLINAGIANPVRALRNGTIGWVLDGFALSAGSDATPVEVSAEQLHEAEARSWQVAYRAGVRRVDIAAVAAMGADAQRNLYCFDVRSATEHLAGHPKGFVSVPGGQLVQETDHYAPVRGARIVLFDDLGSRANMTASWLAQMGWEVAVLDREARPNWTAIAELPPLRPSAGRYRRPYEGTDNAAEKMQAYLDWEYGLVAQLERDGTHGFYVI